MSYFEKVTPEEVGISSESVLGFLDEIRRKGIELHSLMVIRHGKCCASGWWKPYGPNDLHPLYSFSKTLTAMAIGFARQEGLLSLDDRIADLFPESVPPDPSENLLQVTIHHLLCMSCGQETESPSDRPDWLEQFFRHPFLHRPGTFYKYNTTGTNVLAAVIKKKTGQNVTEYLRPRLLEPLGIREICCVRLPGPDPVELGGGGMKLTTESMARFALFLLQRGRWEGKQLLEEEWFEHALVRQIETAGDSEHHIKDWAYGYGYQCWMCSLPGSFRADGAYGQFGFVYPSLDLIVVTTAATEQTQSLVDALNGQLLAGVGEEAQKPSPHAFALSHRMEHLGIPVLTGGRFPAAESELNNRLWVPEQNPGKDCLPLPGFEELIGGAGLFAFEGSPVTAIRFSFEADTLNWTLLCDDGDIVVQAALDGCFSICACSGHSFAATARWRGIRTLEAEVRRLDAVSGARFLFFFTPDGRLILESEDTLISAGGLGMVKRGVFRLALQEASC